MKMNPTPGWIAAFAQLDKSSGPTTRCSAKSRPGTSMMRLVAVFGLVLAALHADAAGAEDQGKRDCRIAIGMTVAEATARWGPPMRIHDTVTPSGTRPQWL